MQIGIIYCPSIVPFMDINKSLRSPCTNLGSTTKAMLQPRRLFLLTILASLLASCQGQSTGPTQNKGKARVGGGCEGCELMYVGMPKEISSTHTSPGWKDGKQKLLLTGKVFKPDGRTPAPNVVIYYWHTDSQGLYSSDTQTPGPAKPHGRLRGWVKSDKDGNYTIRTSRPAAYPNDVIPQHIHLSIKEPEINEYYADLYFDDDPLYLGHKKKYGQLDRAGTEILRVLLDKDVQVAEHNIIVGLNIPDYPEKASAAKQSGLEIGEDQPSFSDAESEANLNRINPNVENTFVIYRHRTIMEKYIDLKPTEENFRLVSATLDKTRGNYFNLAEPKHD